MLTISKHILGKEMKNLFILLLPIFSFSSQADDRTFHIITCGDKYGYEMQFSFSYSSGEYAGILTLKNETKILGREFAFPILEAEDESYSFPDNESWEKFTYSPHRREAILFFNPSETEGIGLKTEELVISDCFSVQGKTPHTF